MLSLPGRSCLEDLGRPHGKHEQAARLHNFFFSLAAGRRPEPMVSIKDSGQDLRGRCPRQGAPGLCQFGLDPYSLNCFVQQNIFQVVGKMYSYRDTHFELSVKFIRTATASSTYRQTMFLPHKICRVLGEDSDAEDARFFCTESKSHPPRTHGQRIP